MLLHTHSHTYTQVDTDIDAARAQPAGAAGAGSRGARARAFNDGSWRRVFREAETAEDAESLQRQVDKARRKILAAAAELTLESLPARDKALLHAAAARKQALHRQRAKILNSSLCSCCPRVS